MEGVLEQGYVQKVAWEDVDCLLKFVDYRAYRDQLHNERTEQDAQRFAGLAPVSLQLTVRPEEAKPISDKLIGIFFEDINYGADGGLYAELVQNRDFEYLRRTMHIRDLTVAMPGVYGRTGSRRL